MILDPATVDTLDIYPDGYPRHIRKAFVISPYPLGDMFRGLIVIQIFLDHLLKLWMLNDGVWSDPIILLSDIAFVLGVFGVVSPSDASLF